MLVAFAGHGIQRGGRAYLLPTDAQLTDDIALLEETAVNVDVIVNWIRQARVSQVVLIIDACRSDPTSGRGDSGNPLTEAYTRALSFDVRNREVLAFATLFATEVGHVAYEYKEKRQGYFSWALVQGLKGAAANEKGEVTLAGLKNYIEEEVPRLSVLDLGVSRQQRPFTIIEGYRAEDLVISAATPSRTTAEEKNNTLGPAEVAVLSDFNAWNRIKSSTKPEDYRSYLKEWPDGAFAWMATYRLNHLEASATSTGASGPMIGIKAFENPPNYYNSTIGNGLSDLFTTELGKTGKYRIVEREAVADLVGEVDLGKSGYGDKATAVPKGHSKGLEYLFICKVTNFGERKSGAFVRLDFRIVDAITREVVYVGSGEGTDSTRGVSPDGGAFGSGTGVITFSDRSFLDSKIGRATMKALKDVIDKMDHNFLANTSRK
jgi:curli biogenesis system outer membrane secretion channel CsgG